MEFYQHFAASILVGVTAFVLNSSDPIPAFAMAILGGSLIDLDHFPLKYLETGNWEHLEKAVQNPVKTVTENEVLLGKHWLEPRKVMISHSIIVVSFTSSALLLGSELMAIAAASSILHLLMDVFHDWRLGNL
ncbi:MAG: hypothetical protein ABEJ56_04225 [Candidatus Nanohaloarchaea archaeon]